MKVHKLKTVQPYFQECWSQSKTFEVRKNDRHFEVGDEVHLQEYDAKTKTYSGKEIRGTILYVLKNFVALEEGYVVFSFCIDRYIHESNIKLN